MHMLHNYCLFVCIGEMACNEQITDPFKKFEIQTFNVVIDLKLSQLEDRFSSSNIGPLKDLSLLSRRKVQEISKTSSTLPQNAFEKLCLMNSKMNQQMLVLEYLQFCSNFSVIESTSVLPETLHSKDMNYNDLEEESEINDVDTDSLDEDTKQNKEKNEMTNLATTLYIFKIFCVANLASVFPNLYYVFKLCVTFPVSSCSVEKSFSKLKLIKLN